MLVLFGVWGGMWNLIVSAPDHCLLVSFHSQPKLRAVPGRRKSSPSAKAQDGESMRGDSPSHKEGLGDLAREKFRFRKAVCLFVWVEA